MKPFSCTTTLLLSLSLILQGCTASQNKPASAIEAYTRALVSGEYNQVASLSCAGWESQARTEFDSFAAVVAEIQEMECKISGQEGEYTLVSCSGTIIANYGNEVLEIDLANQTYLAVEEAGEWRMCGYQ